jgi:Patatin-like phospholipase
MFKRLTPYIRGFWYSLPIQLLMLHFRRNQVLLLFWYLLFAVVNGSFLYKLGAHMLYLYPEYLGKVGFVSSMLVGISIGIFIMSWNITTFILHSRQVEFLATTMQPFLKYCFNNALLPLIFLVFYLIKGIAFSRFQELAGWDEIFWLTAGFLTGLFLSLVVAFSWFFGADHTIYRYTSPGAKRVIEEMELKAGHYSLPARPGRVRVDWYLTPKFRKRQPRDTRHYTPEFIARIFTQHHYSAMLAILLAFISLIISGYFIDNRFFQVPAAASITVIYAILVAVAGAVTYFLQRWSIPFVLLLFLLLNGLYKLNILDPRNKAYGLDYAKNTPKPLYNRDNLLSVCRPDAVSEDSLAFIKTLEQWKLRQKETMPVLVLTCVSGGGIRSATFTTEVLFKLDNVTGDRYFGHTSLISGASGGIMGAAWYRELKSRQMKGLLSKEQLMLKKERITTDLLNPVFSSFAVRDLLAPPRRFNYNGTPYIKDRGFAFEQQLSKNTEGWLDKPLEAYRSAEETAQLPSLFVNAVITADGRSMVMATRPVRFLMKPRFDSTLGPQPDADAICFQSFFAERHPGQLRFLTAMRMSATFPYVLPSVWLPTEPVIDVMDAGFRDNTGIETAMKYLFTFRDWIAANCSKVVLVEIRDKPQGGWNRDQDDRNIFDLVTRPALLTQNNLFRFQEYQQLRQLERVKQMMGDRFERVVFEYKPRDEKHPASLSFHLTQREKRDIISSLRHPANNYSFERMGRLLAQ